MIDPSRHPSSSTVNKDANFSYGEDEGLSVEELRRLRALQSHNENGHDDAPKKTHRGVMMSRKDEEKAQAADLDENSIKGELRWVFTSDTLAVLAEGKFFLGLRKERRKQTPDKWFNIREAAGEVSTTNI